MPKKEQIPQGGTKLPKKPMPKQDKGGGIIPAAEGARFCPCRQRSGAAKRRPAACYSVHCSLQKRGKPAVDIFRLLVMITVFGFYSQKY